MISGQKGDLGINFAISVERRDGMLAVFQAGSE
jgi:hypothetical protein